MTENHGNGMVFQELSIPEPDTKPELNSPDASDVEAPYGHTASGRIRTKPVGTRANTGASNPRGNVKLAEDAASVLTNLNNVIGLGMGALALHETMGVWLGSQETFKAQAVSALENDPALCRTILKTGTTGGKIGLLLAYGMLALSVAPMATAEIRARRADGELASDQDHA